jgi:hypothetical protein
MRMRSKAKLSSVLCGLVVIGGFLSTAIAFSTFIAPFLFVIVGMAWSAINDVLFRCPVCGTSVFKRGRFFGFKRERFFVSLWPAKVCSYCHTDLHAF